MPSLKLTDKTAKTNEQEKAHCGQYKRHYSLLGEEWLQLLKLKPRNDSALLRTNLYLAKLTNVHAELL